MNSLIDAALVDELLATAAAARQKAYAPYSRYQVGAAVLADDGRIYAGANVENVSYGLTVCAERVAVFKAVTAGAGRLLAVAVATENGGSPCGACRQVLVEFARDIPVWLVDGAGHRRETTLYQLLPDHFGPEHLVV
jgi:cytidine deaminase